MEKSKAILFTPFLKELEYFDGWHLTVRNYFKILRTLLSMILRKSTQSTTMYLTLFFAKKNVNPELIPNQHEESSLQNYRSEWDKQMKKHYGLDGKIVDSNRKVLGSNPSYGKIKW